MASLFTANATALEVTVLEPAKLERKWIWELGQ
jgi:hypothetical protein